MKTKPLGQRGVARAPAGHSLDMPGGRKPQPSTTQAPEIVLWHPGPQPPAAFAVATLRTVPSRTLPDTRAAANSFLMSSPCAVWPQGTIYSTPRRTSEPPRAGQEKSPPRRARAGLQSSESPGRHPPEPRIKPRAVQSADLFTSSPKPHCMVAMRMSALVRGHISDPAVSGARASRRCSSSMAVAERFDRR